AFSHHARHESPHRAHIGVLHASLQIDAARTGPASMGLPDAIRLKDGPCAILARIQPESPEPPGRCLATGPPHTQAGAQAVYRYQFTFKDGWQRDGSTAELDVRMRRCSQGSARDAGPSAACPYHWHRGVHGTGQVPERKIRLPGAEAILVEVEPDPRC